MSYNLDIECEPDYLRVKATGIRSIETIVAITRDYIKANEKHGYKKVLVDARRLTGKLSFTDTYHLGKEEFDKFVRGYPQLKVAVVDLEEHRERFRFFEDVLVNKGFDVRFFSEIAAAQRWLGGNEDISNKSV